MGKAASKPPAGAPAGTVWFGGPIPWFSISLSVYSDNLDPDKITHLIGIQPDVARKPAPTSVETESTRRASIRGSWSIKLLKDNAVESDLEEALVIVLDRVRVSPDIWKKVLDMCEARIFIGLTLDTSNRGFRLSSALLRRIADLGLILDFDVYAELKPD